MKKKIFQNVNKRFDKKNKLKKIYKTFRNILFKR
jgi:hypothetical protein